MNCPSRTDPEPDPGWNQSPNHLAADTTTNNDLGKMASARVQRDHRLLNRDGTVMDHVRNPGQLDGVEGQIQLPKGDGDHHSIAQSGFGEAMLERTLGTRETSTEDAPGFPNPPELPSWQRPFRRTREVLWQFVKFLGPGFMIAVAYIDPGNYATDAAAGATYKFKLLFMVLISNIFAILLQSLCLRMSTVTGLNLAEMNKAHCPLWLNYVLWAFGEAAVIATDIAEVIGFAIALNLLAPKLPLVAGCAISIVDVMFILMFYQPSGSMTGLRVFEGFVMLLVLGVAVCFCFQLSLIQGTTVGEVFKGYLPSSALVEGEGLYQACGILGATVMPHSLYLGSGLCQPRLKQWDLQHNPHPARAASDDDDAASLEVRKYRPSLAAIQHCLKYSIWELGISLFTFALFINSAILIICGASLSDVAGSDNADLFAIYGLLRSQVGQAAATVFAVALLLSGCSAGIVCTMAGQMISEGQIDWNLKPWATRLLTRSISIVPAIIVAGTIGRDGVSKALVGSQVALSVILPFVTAPLIYYTCRNKYMTVLTGDSTVTQRSPGTDGEEEVEEVVTNCVKMRNHWLLTVAAVLIWVIIVVMNVANIVLAAMGVN